MNIDMEKEFDIGDYIDNIYESRKGEEICASETDIRLLQTYNDFKNIVK
jgi:hypothetical protein